MRFSSWFLSPAARRSGTGAVAALFSLVLAGALVSAGCAGGPRRGRGGPPPEFKGPRELRGEAVFFGGEVVATVSTRLGVGGGGPGGAGRPEGGGAGERPRGRPPGGEGPGGGGGGGFGSGPGGPPPGGMGGGGRGAGGPGGGLGRGPGVRLTLELQNRGAAEATLQLIELASGLGNFALRPESVTLARGATVMADPMTSFTGIPDDGFTVRVTLRRGGQTEVQTWNLHPPGAPVPGPTPPKPRPE